MRRTLAYVVLSVGLCGVAACGSGDDFADATPETAALQLELTGDATEGLATASDGESSAGVSGAVPEYLQHARDGIRALNDAVASVLKPVEQAVAADAAKKVPVGDTRTYGPYDQGAATFRFIIRRLAPKSYAWRTDAKPVGDPDTSYVTVMGGLFQLGDQPHHGTGGMGIDLDKLASVDADFHGNGQLLAGFAHVAGFKVLAYALHNFSPDVRTFDPIDAVYTGWKGPLGVAHVRLATYANVADSPTAAKELVLLHARWLPGIGGRADALVLGGDVPANHVYVVDSCWARDLTDVDGFYAIRDCQGDATSQSCTVIKTAGALANCVKDAGDEELPSSNPMDPTPEPGAPMNPSVPASMPSGN
jgi:hypothetical protein